MTPYDSISPIGMSPLGAAGLDYSGAYGSYGDPMMMTGMMGGMGAMGNMGAMGAMGMMGMYNPTFMKQMIDMQHQMESAQLNHAQDMHNALVQAEVTNLSAHDRAIFQKISVDGDVQREIRILGDVVRKGDSDAIVAEYDKLKSIIYTKFAEDFKNNLTGDASLNADRYIEIMYSQIVSKQAGEIADLRHDIKKYGETAFMHGFNKTFLGNSGHNQKYSEEVLSYIDGNTRINDLGSKQRAHKIGGFAARGAEGAVALGAGAAAGIGLLGISKGVAKGLFNVKIPFFKNMSKAGWIGGLSLLAGDILWQISRNNA